VAVALGFPVAAAASGRPAGEVLAFAACGALVVLRHRDNIDRLRRGEEASLRSPDHAGPGEPIG
jgi:glycerol-3-phosphate acyltransferase PlsY